MPIDLAQPDGNRYTIKGSPRTGPPSVGRKSMVKWQCSNCRYIMEAEMPPETCPSCKETCAFIDVSCYTPECGGPDNIDPQLVGKKE